MLGQLGQIKKVASLGPVEKGKDLVRGEFLNGQRWSVATGFGRPGSMVASARSRASRRALSAFSSPGAVK